MNEVILEGRDIRLHWEKTLSLTGISGAATPRNGQIVRCFLHE